MEKMRMPASVTEQLRRLTPAENAASLLRGAAKAVAYGDIGMLEGLLGGNHKGWSWIEQHGQPCQIEALIRAREELIQGQLHEKVHGQLSLLRFDLAEVRQIVESRCRHYPAVWIPLRTKLEAIWVPRPQESLKVEVVTTGSSPKPP